MQLNHRPTKILATGKSGSGKTTYWCKYLSACPHDKIFIFDHEGEFSLRTKIEGFDTLKELEEIADEKGFRYLIYDPVKEFTGDVIGGFDAFCEFVFEWAKQRTLKVLLATDELQKLLDTYTMPQSFSSILETGRRYGIDLFAVCQQPNLLHNRIRNQLTEVITFGQNDERAAKFLEEIGFNIDEIKSLAPGKFLLKNLLSGAEVSGKVF